MSGLALQVKRPSGLTTGRFHYRINLSPLFDPLEHLQFLQLHSTFAALQQSHHNDNVTIAIILPRVEA